MTEEKKNWLIRTHDHYLLGPVSLQKVQTLVRDKTLHPLDEVSCGNGFWFFIREKELVQKYLFAGEGDLRKRPISLVEQKIALKTTLSEEQNESDIKYPSSADLDYPEEKEEDDELISLEPSPPEMPLPGLTPLPELEVINEEQEENKDNDNNEEEKEEEQQQPLPLKRHRLKIVLSFIVGFIVLAIIMGIIFFKFSVANAQNKVALELNTITYDILGAEIQVNNVTKIRQQQSELPHPALDEILKITSELMVSGDKCEQSYFECKKLLELIHELPHKTALAHILELLIAVKKQNLAWSKEIIIKIINSDLDESLFELTNSYHHRFKQLLLGKNLTKFLNELQLLIQDHPLYSMLLTHWRPYLKDIGINSLEADIDAKLSKNDLWEIFLQTKHQNELSFFWIKTLATTPHGLKKQYKSFAHEQLLNPNFYKFPKASLVALNLSFLNRQEIFKNILQRMEELLSSKKEFDEYELLLLLENPSLKKSFEAQHKEFMGPINTLRKAFFQRLLDSSAATDFTLYNLHDLSNSSSIVR